MIMLLLLGRHDLPTERTRLRTIYSICLSLLLPLIIARLFWLGRKNPAYRQRIAERFACIPQRNSEQPLIWLHAVSVGETIAATPLINSLLQHHPDWQICVTTTTPTGSDRVKAAFADKVLHVYMPYDLGWIIRRFIKRLSPQMLIVMETELWPNTLACCKAKGIATILANGRLSAKSAKNYARVLPLARSMMRNLSFVAAQSNADAKRFRWLGVDKHHMQVTGSIKFDIELSQSVRDKTQLLRESLAIDARKVAVFASTHAGEDELILPMIKRLQLLDPDFLAIMVPRHLERFDVVASLAEKQAIDYQRLSDNAAVRPECALLLADTMGDLLAILGVAKICFVGGSLIAHGGHNYLEAAAWRLPIITGPSTFNFQSIAQKLDAAQGLYIAKDAIEVEMQFESWLRPERDLSVSGEAAYRVFAANQGALAKLEQHIVSYM